ncbi:unnamed protein product [Musa acuminata subsp. malaccensis]|uniref:(wild Malaysian banana) hypothetical protein n=1 Tax=Musa acuminata subsp. malaccensis TaxID=214687 RepID=A0A804INV7_MUSAM|nr:PREDICTED: B3 domain-containing protein Os03g0120900-like [Musa acuminata subsp. malaccensis]CAG1841949.1 unnamed protein product [Musa acuminata subsp. malaccensis]
MEVFTVQMPFAAPSSSSTSSVASDSAAPVEPEHMFDKVVTPSDVGKLNRLVIPKQYAERYFPLDPLAADKGILLCFEDRTGKQWQFRYSYWGSSQSYVMTKGWSRFVKDKQLESGDTVSFGRASAGASAGHGRLFIGWRRRKQTQCRPPLPLPQIFSAARSSAPQWGGLFPFAVPPVYNMASNHGQYGGGRPYSPPQVRVQPGGGVAGASLLLDSAAVIRGTAKTKRVRLFGVDLECSEREERGDTRRDLQVLLLPKHSAMEEWSC